MSAHRLVRMQHHLLGLLHQQQCLGGLRGTVGDAPPILGYNSSKTALNAVTLSLAKELAGYGISVNAADPGYTVT